MYKFKIGDTVKRIKTHFGNHNVGDINVIKNISMPYLGLLSFDNDEHAYNPENYVLVKRSKQINYAVY
jgi:hypothetical protein